MGDDLKSKVQALEEKYENLAKSLREIQGAKKPAIDFCTGDSTSTSSLRSSATRVELESFVREKYPTKHKKACALIIRNSFQGFCNAKLQLKFSGRDEHLMKDLWVETLGCELFMGVVHVNQTAKQVKLLLKEMSQLKGEYDYVVVVISTHGGHYPESVIHKHEAEHVVATDVTNAKSFQEVLLEAGRNTKSRDSNYEGFTESWKKAMDTGEKSTVEVFFGDDWVPVREREVKKYFYNTKASSTLREIPKFFILNYCRGFELDLGHRPLTGGFETEVEITSLLPSVSDMLVVYATHPEYAAWGNNEKGSWLILTINEVFKDRYEDTDVVSMLTLVNKEMKTKVAEQGCLKEIFQYKAMSLFESSLAKDFYLEVSKSEEEPAAEPEKIVTISYSDS